MPCFGSIAGVFPIRLGGTDTNGWTAQQHARFCADLVAVGRTLPIATWTYTKSGSNVTITSYQGRNGTGLAYAPQEIVVVGTGNVVFRWTGSSFPDPYDQHKLNAVRVVAAVATVNGTTGLGAAVEVGSITGPPMRVDAAVVTFSHAGTFTDATATVRLWGTVADSARRAIGDYAGDPDKHDSETEGRNPYAEFLLAEFQSQRGTAYTKDARTLVDAENVALARFFAACGPRNAEKFRKNMLPGKSDERLPYWVNVLAVPQKPGEQKWLTRKKAAARYPGSQGANSDEVRAALTRLLGNVFVDISWTQGASLSAPPPQTYWPTINPGSPSLSLGGGAWTTERNHLVVTVKKPAGMSVGEFRQLLDVDMFQLLDEILPAPATFAWQQQADSVGFFLDISPLDFTALT